MAAIAIAIVSVFRAASSPATGTKARCSHLPCTARHLPHSVPPSILALCRPSRTADKPLKGIPTNLSGVPTNLSESSSAPKAGLVRIRPCTSPQQQGLHNKAHSRCRWSRSAASWIESALETCPRPSARDPDLSTSAGTSRSSARQIQLSPSRAISTARAVTAAAAFNSRLSMAEARFERPAAETIVIPAKSDHLVTIVFLHGLGDTGAGWADVTSLIPVNNVKWVLPSAPIMPVSVNGGLPCPSWFDIFALAPGADEDKDGIDAAAKYIAKLLQEEKKTAPDAKIIVGGFSQGGALSLYLTKRKFLGTFLDGSDASVVPLSGTICLSGWLPLTQLDKTATVSSDAKEYPLLMCHGQDDPLVQYAFGARSAKAMKSAGFNSIEFKGYADLDHSAGPEELQDIRTWLDLMCEA